MKKYSNFSKIFKMKKKTEGIQVYRVDYKKMNQMAVNIKLGCDLRKNFIPKDTKLGKE